MANCELKELNRNKYLIEMDRDSVSGYLADAVLQTRTGTIGYLNLCAELMADEFTFEDVRAWASELDIKDLLQWIGNQTARPEIQFGRLKNITLKENGSVHFTIEVSQYLKTQIGRYA